MAEKEIVCFDTSGLNHLMDDPESEQLTSALQRNFTVYITAVNITELLKTTAMDRREKLRTFAQRLAQGLNPLGLPHQLVQCVYKAFHNREKEIVINFDEWWWAMSEPHSVGDPECLRLEIKQWVNDCENSYKVANKALRPELDSLLAGHPDYRPNTPKHYLRFYMKKQPHTRSWRFKWLPLYGVTAEIYKGATDCVLPLRQLDAFLSIQPSIWQLYLAAEAYSIYYGAVWEKEHGRHNLAGKLDLWSAVYLPFCDVFVTHDTKNGGQFSALRFLNAFNSRRPRTHVLRWDKFRAILSGTLQTGAS